MSKSTVSDLVERVRSEIKQSSLDISEVIFELKSRATMEVETEETELQKRLVEIRTLKAKLSKI